jgi:hypothetical protein
MPRFIALTGQRGSLMVSAEQPKKIRDREALDCAGIEEFLKDTIRPARANIDSAISKGPLQSDLFGHLG